MKNIKRLFCLVIALVLLIPFSCKAEGNVECNNITDLENALTNGTYSTITLGADIETDHHISVSREVTIDGQGHTIKGSEDWYTNGTTQSGDQAIITAMNASGKLTLKIIILTHGPKQGAQAYGGGTLTLENVTISDCKYSGLISNGGIIRIKDVKLNTKGGIEVGISDSSKTAGGTDPEIIMDGTIESTSQVILYMDPSTKSDLVIKNEEGTKNRIYANDKTVVITDDNNKVLYESMPISSDKSIKADNEESENVTINEVTIKYGDKTEKVAVITGGKLADLDLSHIKNAIEGMTFVNFTTDNGTVYDESTVVTQNITLTANYKDIVNNPNTSDNTSLYFVIALAGLALAGVTTRSLIKYH